jgi:hypothetical protein
MGVPDGLFGTVESVSACPPIESVYGRVVLTTVSHLNNFVFNLTLADGQGHMDNLGVTGWHKFYTEDRGWVSASELYLGETVRTAHGDVMVAGLVREPGVYRVYNMTVEADHVYYVGDLTALTHNVGCSVDGWIPKGSDGWKQVFMKNWTPADEQAFYSARADELNRLYQMGLSRYENMQRMQEWVKRYLETHKK